jgi:hypothetical protein|tara:strand:- start:732 stop:2240 length:1509 start_codon:yes stop_codon:yes gene_type:complete
MTPNEAAELMRRAQVGGIATSEFDAGGGYAAVKKLAESNTTGYQAGVRTVADMAKYAPTDAITRFDPAGQGGLGETFYASGNSATGGAPLAAAAAAEAVGYSGLAGANKGEATPADRLSGYGYVTTRALAELSLGRQLDNSEESKAALNRAGKAMYDDVGANLDARNWNAIMASKDPLKAAEDALKAMYSDKAYLNANTSHVLAQGYLPEQADHTYKQMATRVGSTYDPNWSKGTKFEGQYDTAAYLNNIKNLSGDALATYENSVWTKWGGNPRVTASKGVVNTGASTNSAFVPATTAGQITGTSNTTPGATINAGSAAVTGGAATGTNTVTPGSTGGTGLIAGATTANSTATSTAGSSPTTAGLVAKANTQTLPIQLNAPTATGGGGLLTGANTLGSTPGTFSIPNTLTGNVNDGGLISGVAQQLSTQNAQVGLPTGMTPKIGVMGNNTGAESITAYNPYGFTGANTATGNSQNWYNSKTGQRYTAPAGTWAPPSADWAKA